MTNNTQGRRRRGEWSERAASEVRAELGRQGMMHRELADRMGVTQVWLSRRLGRGADVDLTIEEVYAMAEALGVPAVQLLVPVPKQRRRPPISGGAGSGARAVAVAAS